MRKLIITGNLGNDAGEREIGGRMYASFSVGVQAGKDQTMWVDVLRSNHEKILPYLKKGQKVLVSGNISVGAYKDRNGNPVGTVTIWADEIELLGSRQDAGQAQHTGRADTDRKIIEQAQKKADDAFIQDADVIDGLPF